MSKNKIIFAVIWLVSVILLLILVSIITSSWGKKSANTSSVKEFSVWVVGDETAWFSDIITWFKQRFPQYKTTDIKFTKFSSYEDYERTLLMVMADGGWPDMFVVNNNWWDLLESKIYALSDTIINIDDFEKRYNKAFDDLVIKNKEKNEKWEDIVKSYLKWIPLWYETLWVFYNWRLLKNVPLTWSDLDDEISSSSGSSDYSTVALWLSLKYIFNSWDIFSALLLQNWITSYKDLTSQNALKTLKAYESYWNDPNNNILSFKDEMDSLGFTSVDLFVRWKVWMIIGYPSLIKEIELAIKRSGWNSSLNERFLRSSVLPQISSKWKDEKIWATNIINYNYLAVSKISQNKNMAFDFLSYLSRQEAQEKYLKVFPYYLPSQKALEQDRLQQDLSKSFDRIKYSSFLVDNVDLAPFDKWLKTDFDNYLGKNLWENILSKSWEPNNNISNTDELNMLSTAVKLIDCNKNHLINLSWFDSECK